MVQARGRTSSNWVQCSSGGTVAVADFQAAHLIQCHIKDNSPQADLTPWALSDGVLQVSGAPARYQSEGETSKTTNRVSILQNVERGDELIYRVFPQLIPARPYCADDYACGIIIRSRFEALKYQHIQFNRPYSVDWLSFDVDRPDAYCSWDDAGLPAPTVISTNPQNGHAHLAYLLRVPVQRFGTSNRRPMEWLAEIRRGYTRRLGADPSFNGLLLKNPIHPRWRTTWLATKPYTLCDLDSALELIDKKPFARPAQEIGEGRNVWIFNEVRRAMYREAFHMFGAPEQLRRRAEQLAASLNQQLERPLSPREVNAIAASIARWIFRKFSREDFSAIQRRRACCRWQGHDAVEVLKPWIALGISRSTYYRQKRRSRNE